jgi:hypothetical protein
MVTNFCTYFQIGFHHIADINGYDHILFLLVLLSGGNWADWRRALLLITSFTIGHSITLAFSILSTPILAPHTVEVLIPLTIALTAIENLFFGKNRNPYASLSAGLFGLIHGMGSAGYLTVLLPGANETWSFLLAFNLGVEAGQVLFATAFFTVLFTTQFTAKGAVHIVRSSISIAGLLISLFLAATNWINV